MIYHSDGEYPVARALHERALAIRERALGPEHPEVAISLNNLADVYQAMGLYAEARTLYERALAIREKRLGPEHRYVAYVLGGLGGLALEQGQPTEALSLLERAISIYDAHEGIQEGELKARFSLAKALDRVGGDRTRALAEATKAADGYRGIGAGRAKDLAEVHAFLAKHGDGP